MNKSRQQRGRGRRLSRRGFLHASLAVPTALMLEGCADEPQTQIEQQVTATPERAALEQPSPDAEAIATQPGPTSGALLQPTPACADDDEPTPPQTEGPFFTPASPERTSLLEPGIAGTPMTLTGLVLTTDCQPIAGALIDFWQADDAGVYDNEGYTLRGHQFSDEQGRYRLETVMPGLYPGRTRHFHVKVQAPNRPVLTTQLYFPGQPENERDGIFHPDLLIAMAEGGDKPAGNFNFVLDLS